MDYYTPLLNDYIGRKLKKQFIEYSKERNIDHITVSVPIVAKFNEEGIITEFFGGGNADLNIGRIKEDIEKYIE